MPTPTPTTSAPSPLPPLPPPTATPTPSPTPTATPTPVPGPGLLSWVLPFEIAGSYDAQTQSQGDISFAGYWVVAPFGGTLGGSLEDYWAVPVDLATANVNTWFEVVPNTVLLASTSGRVDILKNDPVVLDSGPLPVDWQIHLRVGNRGDWIEYDHVVNLLVSDGDFVEIGQPLGNAAPAAIRHGGAEGEKPVDEFEWGLRFVQPGTAIGVCPFGYLTEAEQAKLVDVLETMVALGIPSGNGPCLVQELSG